MMVVRCFEVIRVSRPFLYYNECGIALGLSRLSDSSRYKSLTGYTECTIHVPVQYIHVISHDIKVTSQIIHNEYSNLKI